MIKRDTEAAETQHRTLTSQLISERTERAFAERLAEHKAAKARRTSWLAEHKAAEERRTCWLALAQFRQQVWQFKIMTGLLFLFLLLSWLLCHYLSA